MNEELANAIQGYTKTVQELFPKVADYLGVDLPVSNFEWAGSDLPVTGETREGIRFRRHGFGIEMQWGKKSVDFDLGMNGELDGIDPWRLMVFAQDNGYQLPYSSYDELKKVFDQLVTDGTLTFSGYILYYLKSNL